VNRPRPPADVAVRPSVHPIERCGYDASVPQDSSHATLHETVLSPRLVVLTLGGEHILSSWGVNCVALATRAGTLVVDPLIAPAHARLVDEVLRRRGFPEVRHVVLTHHHTDHALGAGWFAARGATVISHARCAEAMAAQHPGMIEARRRDPALSPLFADAAPYAPAVTFQDRHVVQLGDTVVEVRHLGPGHTPGDAVVLFPSEDAVACGDLVFAGYHFNYEEADAGLLAQRLSELAALPVSRFVPGHGAPGGREILDAQVRYHAEVERIVASSASPEAARAAIEARFPDLALREATATSFAELGRWP
jgi:glyoxylase-like metal-dependent hydrolase (beta-lactamase superfamily II)